MPENTATESTQRAASTTRRQRRRAMSRRGAPTPAASRAQVHEIAGEAHRRRPHPEGTHTGHKLVGAFRPHAAAVVVATLLAAASSVLTLMGPSRLSDITDAIEAGIMGSIDVDHVTRIVITLAIIYAAAFLTNFLQGWLMAGAVQTVAQRLRGAISRKIDRLPLSYLDSRSTGDVLSRVTNDVDTLGQSMNQTLTSLVSGLTLLIGSTVMMLWTNWVMALSGIAAALLGMVVTAAVLGRSQRYFQMQQDQLGEVNAHVEQTFDGFTVVKAFRGEARGRAEMAGLNERLYGAAWMAQFLSGLAMPLMIFIGNFSYVVVCVVGAALALNGTISFGTIVAFMVYIRLFTQPLQTLSQVVAQMQPMMAAARRVFALLDEPEVSEEVPDGHALTPHSARGDVEIEHLRFGYVPGRTIVTDFSAHIEAGQKVAIVGPTGAGKSTIVNLLMRFYEADSGSISIDGRKTADMTRAELRDLFGMVLQDTWTFVGTLRENLVYDAPAVGDERLQEICEACGLTGLVHHLPEGLDTVLDESVTLSAGQKQLITIARAMVKDAPLLILDEATSSVDTRTEIKVQKAMDRLMHGRTSFVIAHRLSTIKDADLILVLEHGDVVESGTHESLLAEGGAYASLYNSQFATAA